MIGQTLTKQGLILLFTQVQEKNPLFTHVKYFDNTTVTTNNGFVKLSLQCKQSITVNVNTFLPGPSFHDMIRKATISVHLPHGLANSQLI